MKPKGSNVKLADQNFGIKPFWKITFFALMKK
jgi:hypothetical protein